LILIGLRRALISLISVIASMHAVISVVSGRVRRISLMILMTVVIAVVSIVAARRNLRIALHRSVRRIAVSVISFRISVRRLIVLTALRIISAELLIDLLKRFRVFILRAG
jgi:hypothetical protein